MKKLILFGLMATMYFTSCKKEDDVAPQSAKLSQTPTSPSIPLGDVPNDKPKETKHVIGEKYQGGIVFYLTDTSGTHGMIVSESDNGTGTRQMSYYTKEGIGTGKVNTDSILSPYNTITNGNTAKICHDLILNGYDDWYLPSVNELHTIYLYSTTHTNVTFNGTYTSSSISASGFSMSVKSGDVNNYLVMSYGGDLLKIKAIRNF